MNYEDCKVHWEMLVDKFSDSGYQSLDSDERIWFNIRVLIDSVDDGGLMSFYYNSGADHLDETIEDLRKLGEDKVIDLLSQINQLFPGGRPSRDIHERNEAIGDFDDDELGELLEQLDEDFYSLEKELEAKLDPIVIKIINR